MSETNKESKRKMINKIKIGDKEFKISFKPAILEIYEENFNKDLFDFLNPFADALYSFFANIGEEDNNDFRMYLDKLTEPGALGFSEVLYTLIKCGDDSVGTFSEWLNSLDELPLLDLMAEILPELYSSIGSKKKPIELMIELMRTNK